VEQFVDRAPEQVVQVAWQLWQATRELSAY